MQRISLVMSLIFVSFLMTGQSIDTLRSPNFKQHKFSVDFAYLSGQITYGRRISDFVWINFGYGYGETHFISDYKELIGRHHFTVYYQTNAINFLTAEFGGSFSNFLYTDPFYKNPQEIFPLAAYIGLFLKYKFLSIGSKGYWSITKWESKHHLFYAPVTIRLELQF